MEVLKVSPQPYRPRGTCRKYRFAAAVLRYRSWMDRPQEFSHLHQRLRRVSREDYLSTEFLFPDSRHLTRLILFASPHGHIFIQLIVNMDNARMMRSERCLWEDPLLYLHYVHTVDPFLRCYRTQEAALTFSKSLER